MSTKLITIKKISAQAETSVNQLITLGLAELHEENSRLAKIDLVCSNMVPSDEPQVRQCGFSSSDTVYKAYFKFTPMCDEEGYWVKVALTDKEGKDINCRTMEVVPTYGIRKSKYYPTDTLSLYLERVSQIAWGEREGERVCISNLDYDLFRNTFSRNILAHKAVPMEYIVKDKGWLMEMKGYHDINIYYNATDDTTYHGAIVAGVLVLNGEQGNTATEKEVGAVWRHIVKGVVENYYADLDEKEK